MEAFRRRALAAAAPALALALCACAGVAPKQKYQDKAMDFASVKTVAVMPFVNLSREGQGAERTREVFCSMLLSTGALYVLPPGEVARGIVKAGVVNAATPSKDEVIALGKSLGVEAVITGVLKEYGEVRSGNSAANAISVDVQMLETSSGKLVWQAATTKGGIGFWDRMFGGGGEPMNYVTEDAVRDLLGKLFR